MMYDTSIIVEVSDSFQLISILYNPRLTSLELCTFRVKGMV
jgi:hypothetical protein